MSLALSYASSADAACIAEVHMAAFGQNEMLLAQFPTPSVRKISVLVVRDTGHGQQSPGERPPQGDGHIVGYAKWAHPVQEGADYTETPWIWPEGTAWEVLKGWAAKVDEAERKVLADRPCYHLNFLAVDPSYQHRGAGTMMVKWGLERCQQAEVPAYLESTMEAASLYERLGFKVAFSICLQVGAGRYQEVACVFQLRGSANPVKAS